MVVRGSWRGTFIRSKGGRGGKRVSIMRERRKLRLSVVPETNAEEKRGDRDRSHLVAYGGIRGVNEPSSSEYTPARLELI